MTVSQTSLQTFTQIQPDIAGNQLIVYNAVVRNPGACNKEIAEYLRWPINSVTPRTLELRQKEYIRITGTKKLGKRTVHCMEAVV